MVNDSLLQAAEEKQLEDQMIDKSIYVASAGQTHVPFQENEGVPFVPYVKPAKPEPELARLELTDEAIEKGLVVMSIPDKPTSRNQTYIKV